MVRNRVAANNPGGKPKLKPARVQGIKKKVEEEAVLMEDDTEDVVAEETDSDEEKSVNGREDDNVDDEEEEEEEEEEDISENGNMVETISREIPGFWATHLDQHHEVHVWNVDGAAEMDETDFQHDPDYLELSLDISQISTDHRTLKSESQSVQVATHGDLSDLDENHWYTVAYLDKKNPFISTRLVFSPADRPVIFRLVNGSGPVTLVGRLIRRVNEVCARDAVELCKAVTDTDQENEEAEDEVEEEAEAEAEAEDDDEDEDYEEDSENESPVKKHKKGSEVKAKSSQHQNRENRSKKRELKAVSPEKMKPHPSKKARKKSH